MEQVTKLFQRLVIEGIEDDIVKEEQNEENKLDMYDFLHLAYSFLADADTFLTNDLGFKKLKNNLTDWTGRKGRFSMSKVIIYPKNDYSKKPRKKVTLK